MSEKVYSVYIHTNLTNQKRYVGITRRKPELRWGKNGSNYQYSSNPHFYNAIQKYGWGGFSHEVIMTGLTQEEAEAQEIALIALHKSNQSQCGYNIENGGNSTGKMSQSTKQKISKANTGKKRTAEARKKMSDVAKLSSKERSKRFTEQRLGVPSWNAGLTLSEEQKDLMKANTYHQVRCVETGTIYKSIAFAARELGLKASNISNVCIGNRKTTGGYHFEYI